ncbi:MAG: helix-turn-helix domain-containing protein [Chloroflexi bacterium]|nr:helix-turn-helix domain-containing protein [Chloroflexota bacterium]
MPFIRRFPERATRLRDEQREIATLGELLRAARQSKGLSLEQVERTTRIHRRHLEAFEEGNLSELPPAPYVLGLVRTYARYVGLDPEEVVHRFPVQVQRRRTPGLYPVTHPLSWGLSLSPQLLLLPVLFVTLFFLWSWASYQYALFRESPAAQGATATETPLTFVPTIAAPAIAPPPGPPIPSSTPTPSGIVIEVLATQRSWVRVVVDTEQRFEGIMMPGDKQQWIGQQSILLRTGNAGGIDISLNGRRQASLGQPGQVVERSWTPQSS